jgi:hypothetical protein
MNSFICSKNYNKQNSEETTNMYEGYACIPPPPPPPPKTPQPHTSVNPKTNSKVLLQLD